MDPQAELLLRKASEDRMTLDFDLPNAIFGFHAQQAFEKLFNALIAGYNVRFERTHEFAPLLAQLRQLGEWPLPLPSDLPRLQAFAVALRYDDGPFITPGERERLRLAVDGLTEFATARLKVIVPRS